MPIGLRGIDPLAREAILLYQYGFVLEAVAARGSGRGRESNRSRAAAVAADLRCSRNTCYTRRLDEYIYIGGSGTTPYASGDIVSALMLRRGLAV
ncbi:MAG: hypothetical protein ACK41O_19085 [Runella zeae]